MATSSLILRKRIRNVLKGLSDLPQTEVAVSADLMELWITNGNVFVPDFQFVWAEEQQHYRVYIYVASAEDHKVRAGYNICTIKNNLVASGFVMLYSFLHKNRGNKKEI